jgi:hypothetical protein
LTIKKGENIMLYAEKNVNDGDLPEERAVRWLRTMEYVLIVGFA